MMFKEKHICVICTNRSDYQYLYKFFKAVHKNPIFCLHIITTWSNEFFFKDELSELVRHIEFKMSIDSAISRGKAVGLAMISFGEQFEAMSCDFVVVRSPDGFSVAAASAATVANIPIVFFRGSYDSQNGNERVANAISKMAHLHIVDSEEEHAKVIALGEQADRLLMVDQATVDNLDSNLLGESRRMRTTHQHSSESHRSAEMVTSMMEKLLTEDLVRKSFVDLTTIG